jgi:hypothetical protein
MLAVFAEFEREILSERVKAGIAQARAKGTTFGRPKSAAFITKHFCLIVWLYGLHLQIRKCQFTARKGSFAEIASQTK